MNMGTQQNQPTAVVVSVPYGWQRKFHRLDNFGENEADHPIVTKVYYVSPSGHILDTEKELNTYLKQSSLCRCYFNYERHSFDFDPNHRQSIQMEKVESDSSFCIDWASLFQSEFIYSQMVLCHNYLQEQSVDNFLERFRILHRNHNTGIESCNNDNDENEDDLSALSDDALTTNPRFIEWLQSFDHFSVIVLRDGHKMDLDFNLEQLVHLTYELKVAKKLPEDADKLFDDIREMNAMLKHNDPQFRESLNDNLLKQCDCSKSLEAVQHSQSNSSAILDKSSSSSSSSSSMLTTTIEPVVPDFLKLIKSDGSELSSPSCSDSESELDFDDLFGTKSSIIHNHQQQQQRQSQNNSQSHYMTSSELFALLKPKFLPQSQQQQQFTEIKLIPAKSIVNNRIINSNSGNFLSPPSWNHHQQQQFVIPNRQATNKLILTSNGSVGTLPPSIAAIQQQSQSNQATSQIPCNLFLNNTGIANSSSSSTSSSSKTNKKNSANIVHYLPMDPINMANSMCLLTNPTNENHNKNTKKPPAVKKPRNQPRSTSPKTPPKKRNNKKQPVISSIPYNMFTETKQTPNLSMAQVSGSSGAQASSSTIPSGSIPLSSIAYNYQPNATKFSNLLQLPSTTTSSATSSATTTAAATASAIVPKFISTSLPVAPCSSVPPLLTSSIPLSLMSSSGPSSSLTSSPIKPGLQGHSSCASPVVKSSASLVSPSQSPSSLSSSAPSVPSGSPIKLLFLVNNNGQLVPTMVPLSQTNNNTTSQQQQQQQQQPLNNSPIQTSSLNSRSISTTVATTTSAAIYQNSPSSTPSFSSAVPTIVSPSHANQQQQPVQFQINLPMEFLQNSIKNGSPNRVINFNLPSSSSSHQSSPCSNTNGPSPVNDNNNSMTMNRVSLDTNSILAQMWAKRDLFKTVTTAAASSSFVSTSPQTTSVSGNVPIKPNYNLEVPASVIVNQQSNDHQPVVPIQHDDESKDESYKQFVNGSDSSSSQQNLVNWSNVSSGQSFEEEDPNQTLPTLIPSVDPESNTLQFNQEVQDNNNFANLPVSNIDDGGDSVVINQQDKYENQNDYSEVNEDLNNQYFQDTQQQANEELEPERFIDPNEKSILVNNSIVQENQTNFHQQQTESFDYRLNLNDNNNEIFSLETDSVPVLTQFSSTDAAGTSMVISDTEQFIVQTNDETFEEENTPAEFHEDQVPENCSLENIEKQLKDEEDFDEESDDEEELQSLNYDEEDEESFDEEANYQDNLSFQEEEQEVEDDGQVVEDEDGENREFVLDNIDDQEAILSEPVTIISIENDELLPENLAELLVDDNQLFVISDENVPVVALEQDGEEEEELVMDELISPAAAVINQSSSSIGTTASNERQSLDNPMQLLLQLTNGTGYELDDEDYRLKEKLSIKNERTNRRSLSTRIQETELSMVNHQVDNGNEKVTEDEEPTFINQTEEDEDEDAENACDNGDFPVDNNNKELDDDDRQSLKMATTPQSEDNVSTSLPSLNDEEEDEEEDGQNDCAEVVEQDEDFVEDDESFKNVDEVEEPSGIVDENENELSRIVDEDEDGPSRIVDEDEDGPSRIVDEDEDGPSRIVDEEEEEPSRIVDEDEEEPSRIVDEDELSRTTHESLQQSGNEFENQDEDQSSEVNHQSTDDEQEEDDNDDEQDDFSHKDTNSPLFVNVDQEEDVPRQSEQSVGLYEDPENCERGTDSELLQLRSCPSPLISPPILSPTIFQQPADQLDPRNLFEDSGEELSISCPSLGNDDRDDNCPLISPPQMIFANFRNENLDPASLFEDTREENDVRRRDSQGSEDIEVGEEEGDDLPAIDDSDTQDDEEVDTPIVNLYEDRHLDSLESTNRSTTERIEQIRIAIGIDENCCNLTEADTSSAHLLSPPLPISFPNSPIKLPLTDQSIVTDSASGRHVDEPIIDHYRSPLISPSFRMLIPNDDEDEEEEQDDQISTSPETIVDEDELGEINLDGTYLRESQSNVSDRNLVDDESTTDEEDSQFTLTKNKKLKTSTDNSMTSNEVTNGQGGEEEDDEEDDDDDELGTGGDNSADNSSTLDVLRSTERYFKRMKRLKLQLQFQGMPGVTESDDDMSVVRLSPPLPPQERIFDVGSIVWGQQGDVRFWPGKVVPDDEFKIMEDFDNKDSGKILVRWYGSHSYSLMSPENLITLSEGLEAHHHAQKRYRSGKRVNTSISQAIEEAMQDIDTIMD